MSIDVPDGNGSILVDNVRCSGTESKLIDCPHTNNQDCIHAEDVGINCNITCPTAGMFFSWLCRTVIFVLFQNQNAVLIIDLYTFE